MIWIYEESDISLYPRLPQVGGNTIVSGHCRKTRQPPIDNSKMGNEISIFSPKMKLFKIKR